MLYDIHLTDEDDVIEGQTIEQVCQRLFGAATQADMDEVIAHVEWGGEYDTGEGMLVVPAGDEVVTIDV